MTRRNRNRRSAVSDFFAGFNEGYNTLNQVAQDIQMQRAATAEPEFAGATLDQAQPSTEPAKSVQMNGQEARQVGPEQATPDSGKTGLGVNQGVKLSKIEPIRMEATMQALPEVAKVQQRYQIAGRDVNPNDTASVDRGRTLAMADVMARYDPAQAMRMRSDLTRQERDDQRFEWEKGRVARDEVKAKREEADQLWLRNFGAAVSSRDPKAIANFYNQQYQDGLTAKVVPGQNGAFTVVRADKTGKVVDQTPFQNVDQFISSAVPSLLASRDPLKAYQLQQDNARRAEDRTDKAQDFKLRSDSEARQGRYVDAQIANMGAMQKLRERELSIQAEKAKAGGDGGIAPFDAKLAQDLAKEAAGAENKRRAEAGKPLMSAEEEARFVADRVGAHRQIHSDGMVVQASINTLSRLDPKSPEYAEQYGRALKLAGGRSEHLKKTLTASGFAPPGGGAPSPAPVQGSNPERPATVAPIVPESPSVAMREIAARKQAEQEAIAKQEEAKKAELARQVDAANSLSLDQINAMDPDDAFRLLNSPAGNSLPPEVLLSVKGRAAQGRLYRAAHQPRLR